MSGPSTSWVFEVSSPSALLLPQQPCSASAGSKERQTLHRVSELGYQRGHLPAGISCVPGMSSPLQAQPGGIFHLAGCPLPREQLLRVMEQAKGMAPELRVECPWKSCTATSQVWRRAG